MLTPPRGERALPVLAGVLLALAFPPAAFLLPSFVALAPLLVFIAERAPGPAGRWSATRGAAVAGLVFFGARLYWVVPALSSPLAAGVAAYGAMVAGLAAVVAGFGWALHRVLEAVRVPLPLAAALLWTATEWVHAHLGPLAFPWLPLGLSLAPFPTLAGAADLGGVQLLSFWLALVNGAVAGVLLRMRSGRAGSAVAKAAAATALALALPAGYGAFRAATLELRPAARVAVVQPALPDHVRRSAAAVEFALDRLSRLTTDLAQQGDQPDLVVWPEVAIPVLLEEAPKAVAAVAGLSRAAGAPILLGSYGIARGEGRPVATNAAFAVGADAQGVRYDKRRLVPFIERVPFTAAAGVEVHAGGLRYGGLAAGEAAPLFRAGAARAGVLICFESTFPSLAREYRRSGAEVLVNITNDDWFARGGYRATGFWEHPAHLVLRAVETRAGVARAANGGFSLFVDPLGRVHGRTGLGEPAVRTAAVLTTASMPLAVRLGDWVGTSAAIATVLGLGWVLARRRLERNPVMRSNPGEP